MFFYNILNDFIEIKNFGNNIMTVSFVLTIILSIIQSYGISKQGKRISKHKSARAISVFFFAAQSIYSLGYVVYGISKNSLALIINGLLFIFFFRIVFQILALSFKKHNYFNTENIMTSLLLVLAPLLLLITNKDIMLLILFIISTISSVPQIYSLYKLKDYSDIEPKFLVSILVSSAIWLIYGITINGHALILSSIPTIISIIVFLAVYYYRKNYI